MDLLPPSCCASVIEVPRNGSRERCGINDSVSSVDGKEARGRSTRAKHMGGQIG